MLVVGAKEAEAQTVSYRDRVEGDRGAMPLSEAVARLKADVESRATPHVAPPPAPAGGEGEGEKHEY
jgi:threonyl-tRNA synthetase